MSVDYRIVPTLYDRDGRAYCAALNSPTSSQVRAKCILPPNKVIPVIFVPGIMGSNLASTDQLAIDGRAWWPDSTSWALKFRKYTGAQRQQLLHPDRVRVDTSAPVDDSALLKLSGNSRRQVGDNWKNEFIRRGWGGVMQGSYAGLLCALEFHLNRMYTAGRVAPDWQELLREQGSNWGELQGFERLIDSELSEASEYWYPVHAVGYNWLACNSDAGKYLARFIDLYCDRYRRLGYECDRTILVTHSMGGLVARAATHQNLGGAQDKVLGIVHGVQPITGAPAAYKRVRAGNEASGIISAIAAQVLGWSGAEVAPVFAQSPGPLELLPTKQYPKGWLQIRRRETGSSQDVLALPINDPYEEIYRERDQWWRLMDPALIDPSAQARNPWIGFIKKINIAEAFHDDLDDYFHPQSWVHYGADPKHQAWGVVRWSSGNNLPRVTNEEMRNARLLGDNLEGRVKLKVPDERKPDAHRFFWSHAISNPESAGDGTVPQESGRAAEGKARFVARMRGFDHQGSFANPQVQSLTLYCIAKIAQQATG